MSEALKDYQGAKIGMWLFLFTEVLLFGGLFVLYSVYLHKHPVAFHEAGMELDVVLGAANTVVLITSSYFVALAVTAIQRGNLRQTQLFLGLTVVLALTFLVNKFFEWSAKYHHGIFPGLPHLKELPQGEGVFFGLYFTMTGLHGLHVIIGAVIIGLVMLKVRAGSVTQKDFVFLENSALYWHLVDLVWIFLFPLFYLVT